jgi:hypothetical protein
MLGFESSCSPLFPPLARNQFAYQDGSIDHFNVGWKSFEQPQKSLSLDIAQQMVALYLAVDVFGTLHYISTTDKARSFEGLTAMKKPHHSRTAM